ncbi:mechanosensitive ion channel [Roseivirga pacifica]|uniref:mechanosensitive ion channel family protein n=1 Tax=Roseivirga pacifica TaxID=1267423 RepID=UPI002096358A|nr:mechanosensitive ion channel family protein [Roseivirga pacifica]MCO6360706.1 mechanosensitive ion channel [Roseivirga pacifica]MCO6368595.1 mechanosensitive ion channel [Roseivirga pacifica]
MRYIFALVFVCFFVQLKAQEDNLPTSFRTPRAAIENHLKYLQEESFNDLQAARSLARAGIPRTERADLAIELKQIFDGSGHYIDLEDLPDDPNYLDSLSGEHKYIITEEFPDLYVKKYGSTWLYSSESVEKIEEIHNKVFPFGTSKLLKKIAHNEEHEFLGLYYWQYGGILALIIIAVVLHKLLSFFLRIFFLKLLAKYLHIDVANKVLYPAAKPISLLIVAVVIRIFLPVLQLPPYTGGVFIQIADAAIPVFVTMLFYRIVEMAEFYFVGVAHRTDNTLDDHLVPMIAKIMRGFVVVVGFVAVLRSFKVDIWPLLTGLSIGGLAFALAAQDTLRNFFGSLMIFLDKPFQIGDWITSDKIDGTVEEVGFRSTRIRTFRDSVMYVPNAEIANKMVDNHGLRKYRRFSTRLSITYDTPTRLIEVFVDGIKRIVEEHPDTRKDYHNIYLNDYAGSALEIMLYIFFQVPDWSNELRCRQEIMLEVNKLAEHLGVRFAFPTQTLFVEQMPGQKSLTPEYDQTKDQFQLEMENYFKNKEK